VRITSGRSAPLKSSNSEMRHVSCFSGRRTEAHTKQGTSCIAAISGCTYRTRSCRRRLLAYRKYCRKYCSETGHSMVRAAAIPSTSPQPASRPCEGQTLGVAIQVQVQRKIPPIVSCDRCLMQLTRVARHQAPGGLEVSAVLASTYCRYPIPCHE
jgi:hypothetical protein